MLETLSVIGKSMNEKNITWGVGGSLLLSFYQLIDKPNDIDVLVDENDVNQLNQLIASIGNAKEAKRLSPFRTKYFNKYSVNDIDIDIMGGFAIQHNEGAYQLSFTEKSIVDYKKINGVDIPLCSLEDWYILYWLIPGKREKATMIETYLKALGVKYPKLLEEALNQSLPTELIERILRLLN
ncbi:hypothetical protein [Ornithinibacillus caprae]|uniref:hypothetical protein n=1 Tax=Ornithinibacillus caprae TaxID=2678566 RepID=UPI0031B5A2A0